VVFVVGLAAALSLGIGYVLQQRVASHASQTQLLSIRLLWWLMHKPVWWGGIGAMVIGQALGGLALQLAGVALVEPLLSTSLLFAFGFAAFLSDHRVRWHEIGGALLLSAALGVFIAVGNPHGSSTASSPRAVVVLAVGVVAAVVFALVAVGRRQGLRGESVLLSIGAGLLFGLQDAATRASLLVADHHGVLGLVHSAWSYVVIGSAVVGILLSQSAFAAARLDYSLPPITAAEPIAGIALGVTLLGDVVSVSITGLAIEAACVVGMVAGVVLIGRSRSLADCGPSGAGRPLVAAAARHRSD
jgi:drug/metabolite transporter (DMT)-like permease